MYFKPYYLGCLSHASYLLGGENGDAVLIDPRRDVEEYLEDAQKAGLTIRHVIETHLHADFVSGHLEIARRTGATIYLGAKAEATFPHHPVREGEEIEIGGVVLRFLETPGHTPEGITVLGFVAGKSTPRYAFTGDTLFIGDVGRPDLVGSKGFSAVEMAKMLYHSLQTQMLPLADTTEVWPAHGAGSACGKLLSEDRVSTIGKEKATNFALRFVIEGDEEGFVQYATEGLANAPRYFLHDATKNREGARSLEEILRATKPLSPQEVEALSEENVIVLDTRAIADFGAGHLPGAIHIQLEGKFAPWVGNILAPNTPLVVVAEAGKEEETLTRLARIGYENLVGWLEGGMPHWVENGGEQVSVLQKMPVDLRWELHKGFRRLILDVRADSEWEEGHLEQSLHIPLPELEARLGEVPREPLFVLCGSGYRSSIACSLLQRAGYTEVTNIVGGWAGWLQYRGESEKEALHATT